MTNKPIYILDRAVILAREEWLKLFAMIFALLVIYFNIDNIDFIQHLKVELTGIAIGIFLALTIVDKYKDIYKQRQWQEIQVYTYKSIIDSICKSTLCLWERFPKQLFSSYGNMIILKIERGSREPRLETVEAFGELINLLLKIDEFDWNKIENTKLLIGCYEKYKWDLAETRNILIPRVIQYSGSKRVKIASVEFDNAVRDLEESIRFHDMYKNFSVHTKFISFLEASQKLYNEILTDWQ